MLESAAQQQLHLWATSIVMLLGAYGAGRLRILISSPSREVSECLSVLGAGIIMGAGLTVVLPEGFVTFIEAKDGEGHNFPEWSMGLALLLGFLTMMLLQLCHGHDNAEHCSNSLDPLASENTSSRQQQQQQQQHHVSWDSSLDVGRQEGLGSQGVDSGPQVYMRGLDLESSSVRASGRASGVCASGTDIRAHTQDMNPDPEGFETAHLLRIDSHASPTVSENPNCQAVSRAATSIPGGAWIWSRIYRMGGSTLPNFNGRVAGSRGQTGLSSAGQDGRLGLMSRMFSDDPGGQSLTAMLVHSAADGLAVGASSLSGDLGLSVTVAVAVLLHKGPVAFGLTTFLTQAGWNTAAVHSGLVWFSLSAPVCALVSFYGLSFIPVMSHPQSIALAILFSGGTFLFAATQHILPAAIGPAAHASTSELAKGSDDGKVKCAIGGTGKTTATSATASTLAGWKSLVFVVSAFLPLFISALLPE